MAVDGGGGAGTTGLFLEAGEADGGGRGATNNVSPDFHLGEYDKYVPPNCAFLLWDGRIGGRTSRDLKPALSTRILSRRISFPRAYVDSKSPMGLISLGWKPPASFADILLEALVAVGGEALLLWARRVDLRFPLVLFRLGPRRAASREIAFCCWSLRVEVK